MSPTDCSELGLTNITEAKEQLKLQPERRGGKTTRKPRGRQGIAALQPQLWGTEGTKAAQNWISVPPCSAQPCQRLPAALGRGNTNSPWEHRETPHTAPKTAAGGGSSTHKMLNSGESLLDSSEAPERLRPSEHRPGTEQNFAMENGG